MAEPRLPEAVVSGDPGRGPRMPRGTRPYRRHLRNLILDRRLQLRYVATVTLLSAIIAASLGYLIWRQEARATDLIMESAEEFDTEAFDPDLQEFVRGNLDSDDVNLVLKMAAFGVGLALILSLFLILMTHKVAGPLFKVSRHFDDLAAGKFPIVMPLRRLDMMHGFHGKFEVAHEALKERVVADCAVIDKVLEAAGAAAVSRDGDAGKALAGLELHATRRIDSLG